MRTYIVTVGFLGSERTKVLYCKKYSIRAATTQDAIACVMNGLTITEFNNFVIQEVKELNVDVLLVIGMLIGFWSAVIFIVRWFL